MFHQSLLVRLYSYAQEFDAAQRLILKHFPEGDVKVSGLKDDTVTGNFEVGSGL